MLPKVSIGVLENFRDNLGPAKSKQLVMDLKKEDEALFEQILESAKEVSEHCVSFLDEEDIKKFVLYNIMYIAASVRSVIKAQVEVNELEEIYGS